jgi:hypothetical protein
MLKMAVSKTVLSQQQMTMKASQMGKIAKKAFLEVV